MRHVEKVISDAREAVRDCLPDLDSLDDEACRLIVRLYTAAIHPNFIAWMASLLVATDNKMAQKAVRENLVDEFTQNHQGILWKFAEACDALPRTEDYLWVAPLVRTTQDVVAVLDTTATTTLLAVLKNTSIEFIPLLDRIAERLGSNERRYTQVHGEADIAHAQDFIEVLDVVIAGQSDPDSAEDRVWVTDEEAIFRVTRLCLRLLKRCFCPSEGATGL